VSPAAAPARRAAAPARKAPAQRTPARPNLRVVTPVPSRAARTPFVLFSMGVVGAGLAGLLVLNTVVAQDAFTIHDISAANAALAEREQRLQREVAALEAPAAVAARARTVGLVPAGDPVFLEPDGTVLGNPVPATAPPAPPPPAPSASASPQPKAKAKAKVATVLPAKPKPTPTGAR
jgi:cell division protein FtsB